MEPTDTDALDRGDMASLVGGHDAALNDLMDRHATALFPFLCRMLANEEDANDLAQETFVRVYRARESYEPGQKFSTWLFTIAANLARNQLRWRSRHPNVSLDAESETTGQTLGDTLPAASATPHQSTDAAERAEAVRAAVQTLPEDMREAIVLCEWEDMAVAEAAKVLQSTPKAVESRLYRARQLLRDKLKKWL
ncbi:MAG: sigma-70 family RNA polymerase sigma factor [Verrucomicrobia bacterium]|nr:sigma-70 family RNA polymerase sigma factor [Verrucomicrobiota bacterium]